MVESVLPRASRAARPAKLGPAQCPQEPLRSTPQAVVGAAGAGAVEAAGGEAPQ